MTNESSSLDHVIIAYRALINSQYNYQKLVTAYDIPNSFTEADVNTFRDYFLEYIYPHPDQRKELNDAFSSLDNYIKQPEKLLRLILDSASLVFKYGRHLPKILSSGIKALKSYRAASAFELRLVKEAERLNFQGPHSSEDLVQLVSMIPREEMEAFIDSTKQLFDTLHDRKLVEKIKAIVESLITKMKKRPEIYSAPEVNGLEIGRDIIIKGDELFQSLDQSNQKLILEMIVDIQKDFLDEVYA